jgi:hypothetical protein
LAGLQTDFPDRVPTTFLRCTGRPLHRSLPSSLLFVTQTCRCLHFFVWVRFFPRPVCDMSVNHGSIATHIPQSLPSFAQAFSAPSLGSISSGNNSLPPIHTRPISMENLRVHSPAVQTRSRPSSEESLSMTLTGRKRPRTSLSATRDDEASDSE